MKQTVDRKQPNSKMCLVCGLKNPYGLKAAFYELRNGELVALCTPHADHQGYPGRLHGGMATAILDETIGRAIMINYRNNIWGVTLEFTTRFKQPIPLGVELKVVGRITNDTGRLFVGTGEIILPTGEVGASGTGKYMKMPLEKIADFNAEEQEWKVTPSLNDPTEFILD